MTRERIQTRDDPDVTEAIEEMADEKDISKAEAIRRLVRTGLEVKGYRDRDGSRVERAAMGRYALLAILLIGLLAFLLIFFGGV
jgi:hypothetical protein